MLFVVFIIIFYCFESPCSFWGPEQFPAWDYSIWYSCVLLPNMRNSCKQNGDAWWGWVICSRAVSVQTEIDWIYVDVNGTWQKDKLTGKSLSEEKIEVHGNLFIILTLSLHSWKIGLATTTSNAWFELAYETFSDNEWFENFRVSKKHVHFLSPEPHGFFTAHVIREIVTQTDVSITKRVRTRVFSGFGAIDVYGPKTRKNTGP